jgi:hypothetical protein
MKVHEFDPVIYPIKLWVVTNQDESVCDMFKYKYNGKSVEIEDDDNIDWIAVTTNMVIENSTNNNGIIVTLGSNYEITPKVMAHEACHISSNIYDFIGAKEINLGGEQHAYFLDWIVGCIDSVVKTTNNKSDMAKKTIKKGTGKKGC